jgi:hypothetical protein
MRFGEIHIWTCLVLFILSFAIDVVNIRYMMCVRPPKPLSGANYSLGLCLLTSTGVLGLQDNVWNIIPIACGYWLGTYGTLWYELKKLKNK